LSYYTYLHLLTYSAQVKALLGNNVIVAERITNLFVSVRRRSSAGDFDAICRRRRQRQTATPCRRWRAVRSRVRALRWRPGDQLPHAATVQLHWFDATACWTRSRLWHTTRCQLPVSDHIQLNIINYYYHIGYINSAVYPNDDRGRERGNSSIAVYKTLSNDTRTLLCSRS